MHNPVAQVDFSSHFLTPSQSFLDVAESMVSNAASAAISQSAIEDKPKVIANEKAVATTKSKEAEMYQVQTSQKRSEKHSYRAVQFYLVASFRMQV